MMDRINHSVSNALLIAVSSQVSVLYYFSKLDCIVGFEFLTESMSALSSLVVTIFFVYIKGDSKTVSSFYATMVFVSLTVAEHYKSCLEKETGEWISLVFVVVYAHLAVISGFNDDEFKELAIVDRKEESSVKEGFVAKSDTLTF